jgi:ribonuclease HI
MYFDGLVMGPGVGAGVVVISPEGNKLRYTIRLHFPTSNNVAEYEGLINSVRIAIELGVTWLFAYGDSKLVVDQVMTNSNSESPLMDAYCQEVCKLEDNNDTDSLAQMAVQWDPAPSGVFFNDLHEPSIRVKLDLPQK